MSRWFESVEVARRRAERRLPASVYAALKAGSEHGDSYADNLASFSEVGLIPRAAGGSAWFDLSTTVMGQPASMPVVISPTGVQAVHPDGEVAVARASAARGIPMGLSSFASRDLRDVAAANERVFFQMYWMGSREDMVRWMDRARDLGAKGLILTLDWSFSHSRDWGSPYIPERVDRKAILTYLPEAMMRPRWTWGFARQRRIPDLTVPNVASADGIVPTFFGAYGFWMQTPPPTWDDIAWFIRTWGGDVMIKGVWHVDDARRAVDAGATAISVSNHGGNNLDGTPAPLRALPAVAGAVGTDVEVLMDGGIRRGSDVVKAIALGARAVMIGRAYLWGLAAEGQAGVENVLDVLRMGMESTLRGMRVDSLGEVTAANLIVPEGFARQ